MTAYKDRRAAMRALAQETKSLIPSLSAALPTRNLTTAELLSLDTLPRLDPSKSPRFHLADTQSPHGTRIRVFNQDSLDAAIAMPAAVLGPTASAESIPSILASTAANQQNLDPVTSGRVAVLNMASELQPGGGWLHGSIAQEEALCYRSSLSASLHQRFYPVAPRSALYTRDVVVFRTAMDAGHELMIPGKKADELPVVSVLSVAGVRGPAVKRVDSENRGEERRGRAGLGLDKGLVFANPAVRELTKDKMRLCLRMAASRGHVMLVLGALGCGAFRNPANEVANCWKEVLGEAEFADGAWFKEIWFAVYDRKGEGNFEMFREVLDGTAVMSSEA